MAPNPSSSSNVEQFADRYGKFGDLLTKLLFGAVKPLHPHCRYGPIEDKTCVVLASLKISEQI